MHSKVSQFLARLAGWEGFIGTLVLVLVLGVAMLGCSTKWEQQVGDYTASAHWGVDFEENEDE